MTRTSRTRLSRLIAAGLLAGPMLALPASPALADVASAGPDHMTLTQTAVIPLAPDAAWRRLTDLPAWWASAHTYSGRAANLRLDLRPGGCWCERWRGGAVEHARVLYLAPARSLRVQGAFGPLQQMGLTAVWTLELQPGPGPGTTRIVGRYVVTGSSASRLDALAPAVDQVLTQQIGRLASPAG